MLQSCRFFSPLLAIALIAALPCAVSAQEAADAPDPAADSWRFDAEFNFATDDYSSGLTTNDHHPYASTKGTVSFDEVFASLEFSTDGDKPDLMTEAVIGYTPTLGDYAFDFELIRDLYPVTGDEGETDLEATVSYAFSDALELHATATLGLPDKSANYLDLSAGVTYTLENDVTINADVLFEPENKAGDNSYIEVSGGVEVPIFDKFSASASLAYDAYLTDPTIASYAYWDAGVSYEFNEFATFDLRYYDNSLTAGNCADHADFDCSAAIVGSLTLATGWPVADEKN